METLRETSINRDTIRDIDIIYHIRKDNKNDENISSLCCNAIYDLCSNNKNSVSVIDIKRKFADLFI